jgi:cholera toxin transcriptional activator
MNLVPVADEREHQEKKRDQQQPRGFRRIHRVPVMLLLRMIVLIWGGHAAIVAPGLHGTATPLLVRATWPEDRSSESLQGSFRSQCYTTAFMAVPQSNRRVVRFGVFELDLSAGELRKNGVKLRLQGQPFQVLTLLLERSGEVVTREELQQKLWPSDTFVDFDHSLNTAINKVREALGDSASSPRYVETLARRGYRFIAPVQSEPRNAATEPAGEVSAPAVDTAAPSTRPVTEPAVAIHPELEVPIPRRSVSRGLFALTQLMYLIFYLIALFRLRAVQGIADSFLPSWAAATLVVTVMVTAGVGIPLRCYLLSAVGFDYQRLGEKFRQIFPFVLALDQLWAVAPFLLMQQIGLGAAFAVSAALLYLPFSERTLIRMAYLESKSSAN